jgi:hypothetical protein
MQLSFSPLQKLVHICTVEIGGIFNPNWPKTYDAVKQGTQSYLRPSDGGSGLRIEKLAINQLNLIDLKGGFSDQRLDISEAIQTEDKLIYLLISKKYPITYVGITEGGLHNGILNRGRLKHHLNKLLAIGSTNTSHTIGWQDHAIKRYDDNKSLTEVIQSNEQLLPGILDDLYIAFGSCNDSNWSPKDHEGYVLSAVFESLRGTDNHIQILNTGAMSYRPIMINFPNNLVSFV